MNKKWLGVALDTYDLPDNGRNLVASKKAIKDWKEILENSFGFEHIDTENSQPIINQDATRANVLSALNKMVVEATKDDIHVFVFVGHGDFQEDKYSIVQDEILFNKNDCHDEKILLFGSDQITDDEFRTLLNKNNEKGLFIFIFDCCYSGNIKSNDITKQEDEKIVYEETIKIIKNYAQSKSINIKANIYKEFKDIEISKQNLKSSIDVIIEKQSSLWVNKYSNEIISKDITTLVELEIIKKNIIDLRSRLFTRNNPIEVNLQRNEILLCASSAYKKTFQPKIDGEYQSAFSYLLIKNIKEYLHKEKPLNYETLLKLTINKLKGLDVYSYPQLILSSTTLLEKQIFTK
ncbi:caspase family protein [Tenacibaculum aiptasiae]|uniref:caspase family protein n=1 Tax=Tenacibaculum aiptasiae TaxID=426481 RepID=UPI00232A7D84|nr:caspase family protein [Tenacibaculum aiptasiae]